MSKALKSYKEELVSIGCVLCREQTGNIVTPELHHVAEGSGLRSDWMMVPLCVEHHRIGSASLHGAGVKRFLAMHRLPTEYHLIELTNKFIFQDKN